ncbi:hypothetical protein JX265_010116 [Neoarthrinium moseri]|uniref:Uncharacterized protein n=1 Tax=Neoarthrinium moseri TaxID=1658444 RepID=A0A9P9WF79_9PEZI|nr:hypothetical protein JX265_010116 [Neoarthrinium moseri]
MYPAHPSLPMIVDSATQTLGEGAPLARCLQLASALPDEARVHNAPGVDRCEVIKATGLRFPKRNQQVDHEVVKKKPELVRNKPAALQIDHDPAASAEEIFDDVLTC